jgi:hypothetical protein
VFAPHGEQKSPTPAEAIHAVGFRGSGYQRSLPVHESGAYNFSTPPV